METRVEYDPLVQYVFHKAARYDGVDYRPGDPLPEGIAPRKVEQLCRLRIARAAGPLSITVRDAEEEISAPSSNKIDLDALGRKELIELCEQYGLNSNGGLNTLRKRLQSVLD